MSLIQRVLARGLQSASSSLFARSFSVYHALQAKGDFARLRQQDPKAYREKLDKARARLRLWRDKLENTAKTRANAKRYWLANTGNERLYFYRRLIKWVKRYTWFRENLP